MLGLQRPFITEDGDLSHDLGKGKKGKENPMTFILQIASENFDRELASNHLLKTIFTA